MNKMIYDFTTHSLYYENEDIDVPTFSLAIDTLEMVFEVETGKLMRVQGFFPIIRAVSCNIDIPEWEEGDYLINNIDFSACKQNEIYDLIQKDPQTKKYFEKFVTKFDKEKGIIQIGEEMKEGDVGIKVNKNIMCGFDENSNLKCLYIVPTEFVL